MKNESVPGFSRVDHVGITVPDLEAAVNFYRDILGGVELYRMGPFDAQEMPATDGRDWGDAHFNVPGARFHFAMLQFGSNLKLELFQYDRPVDKNLRPPRNSDIGGHHVALRVNDLDKAASYLKQQPGVRVMSGPIVVSEGPCAGLRVNYFLDPWGNQLELVEFDD
jgi:catechol 2,3-dioxygenase-like lactoylglutathione lyase family enzyme